MAAGSARPTTGPSGTRGEGEALPRRKVKPWRRRFPPTREGWWFLLSTLLVGAAAVNAGLNLLFLIFGMMLFLILASGIMSELDLRGLTVTRRLPANIHAGTPFLVGIAVKNDKGRLPTFSLEVEDLIDDRPVERRCYFLKIPAGRQQETAYRNTVPRRGWHRLSGLRLSTRFPFGLIRKSRDIEAPAEVLVLPQLVPVPDAHLPVPSAQRAAAGQARPSRAGEFHGLRDFRVGDDPRQIHWRASARLGRPLLRESEDETGREIVVVLEPGWHDGGAEGDAAFEAAVSMAASVATALARRGFLVGLAAGEDRLPPTDASSQLNEILRRLALISHAQVRAHKEHAAAARGLTRLVVRARRDRPELQVIEASSARRSA